MDDKQGQVENDAGEDNKSGNGDTQSTPLLRPSAFHTPQQNSAPGILAPSRLGNPLASRGFGTPQGGSVPNDINRPNNSLSHNPFAAKIAVLSPENDGGECGAQSKVYLRPSALDRQTANFNKGSTPQGSSASYKSSFKLEPAKLQSPFQQKSGKSPDGDRRDSSGSPESGAPQTQDGAEGAQSEEIKQRLFGTEGDTESSAVSAESSTEKKSEGASGFIFGQNMETRVTAAKSPSNHGNGEDGEKDGEKAGFVFGEKLGDRVENAGEKEGEEEEEGDKKEEEKEVEEKDKKSEEEQTSEKTEAKETDDKEETEESGKSLAESAAIHQAKQNRPELQEVEVKTGEEDESNVFQVNVKLYVFDKETRAWLERGRGLLRLNDMCASDTQSFQSRLVMRTSGSLRVVLNTKIWPEMMIERASPKSLRVSAMDAEEGVKIYLIMANLKDADQIFSAIDSRVSQLKLHESKEGEKGRPATSAGNNSHNHSEKRRSEVSEDTTPASKKIRVDPEQRRDVTTEESNDSSTVDPETEGDPTSSNESFTSSPTIKSSSSDA